MGIIGREGGIVTERESWSWSEAVLDFFVSHFRMFAGVSESVMWVEEVRGGHKHKLGQNVQGRICLLKSGAKTDGPKMNVTTTKDGR